jgi:hypothetical protein
MQKEANNMKPNLLIVDDEATYPGRLELALEDKFEVFSPQCRRGFQRHGGRKI